MPASNVVADKYVLLRRLAIGGMAEVYLARQMGLDGFEKLVVLKRVLPNLVEQEDFLEMFLDEARTAADLRHPNVVNIFEIGQDRGTYYMVMEYLSGQNLRQVQRYYEEHGEGPMPLGHCLEAILGAANGLHYAHTKTDLRGKPLGIVHRDVSPQNVVITYDGAVKIVDFGIAKAASVTTETAPGVVKGKFEYMSPEQADGLDLDARSDQFSLGILLWELTTGERLFSRATDFVTIRAVADCDVRPPSEFVPEYPAELENIVMRVLSKEPDDRYPSCADFAADIEEFLTDARIPHSQARLARYMRELFADALRDEAQMPMSSPTVPMQIDAKAPASAAATGDDFDPNLPKTTIVAVGKQDPATSESEEVVQEDSSVMFLDHAEPEPIDSLIEEEDRPTPSGHVPLVEPQPPPPPQPPAQESQESLLNLLNRVLPDASADATRKSNQPGDPAQTTGEFMVALGDYLLSAQQAARARTNLAEDGDVFIGREPDLQAIHKLFTRGERLVTIVGPGGAGKTRLAQHYGRVRFNRDEPEKLPGGVWFCDLTEAHTDAAICRIMGERMDIPLTAGTDAETVELVGAHLRSQAPVLVILDNFDEIVDFAPQTLGHWLGQTQHVQFLVTSREVLKIPGEVAYELKPLALPDDDAAETSDAVQLFVHRARASAPDYQLSSATRPLVAEIVRRLDGIPLAIELAAGRVGLLGEPELLKRIRKTLDVLSGGKRGAHARQATLRGTIDWSWQLLDEGEKSALAQCSVFRGGFTLEAAERVLDLSDEGLSALDAIQRLREKSLLRGYTERGQRRLGMYTSIREFAAEKLHQAGQTEATHGRHAAYYLRVSREWTSQLYDTSATDLRDQLHLEMENLMHVADRSLARRPLTPPVARRAVESVLALDAVLSTQGPYSTHMELLDAGVNATAIPGVDALLRARVLTARGKARRARGSHTDALADLAEAVSIARRENDASIEAHALVFLANLFEEKGRHEKAQTHFEKALSLARELGDRRIESNALRLLGVLHLELGQLSDAARCLEKSIDLAQDVGDQRLVGMALGNIAGLYRELDQLDRAQETYERALSLFMEIGDRRRQGLYIGYVGLLHQLQNQPQSALAHYAQSVKMAREAGDLRSEAYFLAFLGTAEAELDHVDEAHTSLTMATQQLQKLGDNSRVAVAMLLHGFMDLAYSRKHLRAGDRQKAQAHRRSAQQRVAAVKVAPKGESLSPADRSDEIRVAIRMLQQAMER